MNEYKICFTAFAINRNTHFSGCRATIHGETFDEALEEFRKEQLEKGFRIGFIVEGKEIFEIKFYNKETGEEINYEDLPKLEEKE